MQILLAFFGCERANRWGQTAEHAHAFAAAGWLAYVQEDRAAARPLLEQALAIARISGDNKEIAFALLWLGWTLARSHGDIELARAHLEEGLAIYQTLQDQWGHSYGDVLPGGLCLLSRSLLGETFRCFNKKMFA